MKPRLLDLFCGAGGAAMGYYRAGFEVTGVDIARQPNFPFKFIREDAIKFVDSFFHPWPSYKITDFDAIHASPPCQAFTAYKRRPDHVKDSPDLIGPTRELLEATGLPWVIENVEGASLRDPIQICGTGLGMDVQRHRLFEANFPLMGVPCAHGQNAPRFQQATNRLNPRRTIEIGVWRIPLDVQSLAMGINWMNLEELSEAVPPAYTEHIGHYLMADLKAQEVAA